MDINVKVTVDLSENTIDALKKIFNQQGAPATNSGNDVPLNGKSTETIAAAPAPAPVKEIGERIVPAKAETKASVSEETITLDDVRKATTEKALINKPAVRELLNSFGVGKAGELPEENWPEYLEKLKAVKAA